MSLDANALVVLPPLTITDSILVDSGSPPETNVPEDDYPEWDGESSPPTSYSEGDRVILLDTHKIYESLQDENENKDPRTEPLWWIEVGPTNRWAAFDGSVSTQTKQANNITYTFEPGIPINSLAILNLTDAEQVNIQIVSPQTGSPGIVFSESISLLPYQAIADWYNFFYGPRITPTQYIEFELPVYVDSIITIEILGGADLAVGVISIGQQRRFGLGVRYGARVGIQDYSRKETNEFGDIILQQRAFAKRANFDLFLNNYEVDSLQSFLSQIRATPVLWVGSSAFEATTVFGFYKNFEILINYAEHSDCELEIEGLT
jgi:hypothetical protein